MSSRSTLVWIAVVILSTLPAVGQTGAEQPPPDLADEMQGIRQALDRMADLLETVHRQQEVDLMLKRIELRERRLEPLERRLRSAESEVEGGEDHLSHLRMMKEQNEEMLDKEIREGADEPLSETRRMLDDIERTTKAAEERLENSRMKVAQYENELASGRREIEILDEMLEERLESFER